MAGVRTRILLGVLAALAAVLALPGAAGAALSWRSCRAATGAECATLRVPLDRSGALPGTVALKLARLPTDGARPTLVYLSGGPGGAGIEEMLAVMPLTPFLLDSYRVVGFDQRGTGGSGLLRCKALERDPRLRSVRAGEDCARRLGEKRRLYTTPDSVEDLEAIRAELGVERLTLFGISYGTELALAYARAHPDRVDRLMLDSVVNPDDRDPFGLAGFRAMGPSLAGLCPARCRGITRGRPVELVARLAARLRARGVRGVAYARRCARRCRPPCAPPCGATGRRWRGCSWRAASSRSCRRRGRSPAPATRPCARRRRCRGTRAPRSATGWRRPSGAPPRSARRRSTRSTCGPPRPTRSASACTGRTCRPAACRRRRRRIRRSPRCCCRAARTCARRPRAPGRSRPRSQARVA